MPERGCEEAPGQRGVGTAGDLRHAGETGQADLAQLVSMPSGCSGVRSLSLLVNDLVLE